MGVQLTPGQKAFVRQAIESGRLQREEDAVKEALSLWGSASDADWKSWRRSTTPRRPLRVVKAAE